MSTNNQENTYCEGRTSDSVGYIGLGSNLAGALGSPLAQANAAIQALAASPDLILLRRSPWYQSKAVGPGEQGDYINGVIEFRSQLAANAILQQLQSIENQHGRERHIRWGARTLDLDLLCYGNQHCHSEILTLPHPRIAERNFVLAPLADLNPELRLTGDGQAVNELLQSCGMADLRLAEGESAVVEYHP